MTRSGTVWLGTLLALPLIGAIIGSAMMLDWTADSWRWRSVAWIGLGLGVPLAAALVHTRQVGVILLTLIVGASTLPAWRHLVRGPAVSDTTIVAVDCRTHERRGMRCIEQRLTLGDGRAVVLQTGAPLHPGEHARVTTLDDVALDVVPLDASR